MTPWLKYLIAFVVFCHGFIYVRIGAILPGPVKEWKGRSWLLGGAVTGPPLRTLFVTLHVIAGIATLASAAAIAFAPSVPGLWSALAIGGSAVGIAGFAAFWDGQGRLFCEEGGIGAMVSLILIGLAIAFPHAFQ